MVMVPPLRRVNSVACLMPEASLADRETDTAAYDMRPTLIIFGRLPLAGQCKTRLIPALGPEGAARLYSRMLRRIVQQACASRLGKVVVMLTPSPEHARQQPELAALLTDLEDQWRAESMAAYGKRITLEAQPQGGLGERMHQAMLRHLPAGPVLLMGSDLPALDSQRLREAARCLHDHEAVLQPSEDGGYGLIGLKAACPAAFQLDHWSHADVSRETLALLAQAGRSVGCLPVSWDVDEPHDLVRLRRHFPALMANLSSCQPA